jgi:hypothetical protein
MKLTNSSKTVGLLMVLFGPLAQPATPQTVPSARRFAGNFAEVEITLNDQITLSDISVMPRAPGGDLKVFDGGKRVASQLPARCVEALAEKGAEVAVLRNFVLLEGAAAQGSGPNSDVAPPGALSGDYLYGETEGMVPIMASYPSYFGNGIGFPSAPPPFVVTSIDVGYQVRNLSGTSVVDVELSDEGYFASNYTLVSGWPGRQGDIIGARYGITAFNGEQVNQTWIFWATDRNADGNGYVGDCWIRLYYMPVYCDAAGDCIYEYVRDVVIGTIRNIDSGCTAYSDYTAMSTRIPIGGGCPITVVDGDPYPANHCGIWVDWNRDFDFDDPCETISVFGSPGTDPYTATITPPAGAALGNTRMRVRIGYGHPPEPCGDGFGEVEDYTITVIPEQHLPADLVGPSGVDMRDLAVLAGQWQQTPGEPSADVAPPCPDGVVDSLDLRELADNWLEGK